MSTRREASEAQGDAKRAIVRALLVVTCFYAYLVYAVEASSFSFGQACTVLLSIAAIGSGFYAYVSHQDRSTRRAFERRVMRALYAGSVLRSARRSVLIAAALWLSEPLFPLLTVIAAAVVAWGLWFVILTVTDDLDESEHRADVAKRLLGLYLLLYALAYGGPYLTRHLVPIIVAPAIYAADYVGELPLLGPLARPTDSALLVEAFNERIDQLAIPDDDLSQNVFLRCIQWTLAHVVPIAAVLRASLGAGFVAIALLQVAWWASLLALLFSCTRFFFAVPFHVAFLLRRRAGWRGSVVGVMSSILTFVGVPAALWALAQLIA